MAAHVATIDPIRIPGTDIHLAPAVTAGPWIFLNGIEAVDYAAGLHPSVAGARDLPYHGLPKTRREGDFICARLKELLEKCGTNFANTVRLDQYYPNYFAVDPYHLARHAAFGAYIPPSTSVIMQALLPRAAEITASLLAVVPGAGLEPKRVPTPTVTAPIWSGFVPAVTAGDYVFVAGQMARGADGTPDPRAHVPAHSRWGGYEIRRQTEYLIREKFTPALQAAGSSLGNAVKAQVYLRHVEDTPHFLDVWNSHFGARQCALTIVPTLEFGLVPGNIEVNLVAVTDKGKTKKHVIDGCIPAEMTFGAAAVRAGNLVMCSGMLAVDASGPIGAVVAGREFPYFGGGARGEMEHIVGALRSVCSAAGAPIENVVRIHEFHADLANFYAGHRAWQEALGGSPVPCTAVQVPGPLPVPGCGTIVDAWVYAA